MRNLKRALSLTLASVMLLGMMVVGSSALGFNDADDVSNVTAASVLEELGVMQGDGNGNFMPDQPVTRAQMAIIICRIMFGNRLNGDTLATEGRFSDVAPGAYYTGYVNFAAEQGIISGYGDGRFGPDDTVTTAQAALMLARGLGYYKAGEDQGDWATVSLNAITLATKLKMFGDLRLGTNALLSRDNVCEMTFNTMTKANPVQYSEFFKAYYTDSRNPMNGVVFSYLETFGYKNYDLVYDTVSFQDDFGRPSTAWGVGRYNGNGVDNKGNLIQGGNNVVLLDIDAVVVDPVKADLTYTKGVTGKALASAVGNTAMSYEWVNVTDGTYVNTSYNPNTQTGSDGELPNRNDGDNNYPGTGKGVLTEIYVDGDTQTVTVVFTNTYLAKVTRVSSDDDGRFVTVTLESNRIGGAIDDRNYHTNDFALDDYVLVTVAEDDKGDSYVASVKLAATAEGAVTAFNATGANSYISLDGKRYDCADQNAQDVDDSGSTPTFTDYRLYLDTYGYAIGYAQIGSTIDEYLYISNTDPNNNTYVDGWQARAVFPDGSSKIIDIVRKANGIQSIAQQAYRYELQDDGSYVLTSPAVITNDSGFIRGNEAAIYAADNRGGALKYTTDRNTKFVHIVDSLTFNGYVGYNNVPSIKAGSNPASMWAVDHNGDGIQDIVYVTSGTAENANSTMYYIASTKNGDWETFREGNTNYYRFNEAYVDGVKTPMTVDGATLRDTIYNNQDGAGLYKIRTTNSKGYVTALDTTWGGGDGIVLKGEMNNLASAVTTSIAMVESGKSYAFKDDTIFVYVDGKKVNVGGKSDIVTADKDDPTGVYIAKVDSNNANMATLVYVVRLSNVMPYDATADEINAALEKPNATVRINGTKDDLTGLKVPSGSKLILGGDISKNVTFASVAGELGIDSANISEDLDLSSLSGGGFVKLSGENSVAAGKTLTLGAFTGDGAVKLESDDSGDGKLVLESAATTLPTVSGEGEVEIKGTITNADNATMTNLPGTLGGKSATGDGSKTGTFTVDRADIVLSGSGKLNGFATGTGVGSYGGNTSGKVSAYSITLTSIQGKYIKGYRYTNNTWSAMNGAAVNNCGTSSEEFILMEGPDIQKIGFVVGSSALQTNDPSDLKNSEYLVTFNIVG